MIPLYKNSTPAVGTARLRADFPKGVHVIYFDNAATTLQKPDGVARAVADAIGSFKHMGFSPFSSRRDGTRHARCATTDDRHFWHTLTSLHGIGTRIDDLARLD